ncbi:nuclear transport factor 2 family protein [Gramella jeungdoensis]|uniref:Nuclear transport factor 2 family protein n=1 Tax=Gramella jeungdoensis TaxID=708091 RepID=A0ABT0YZ78_9FLAO|nr:nuclear transport factor 2 family protein [Gramella jeungdoensis]
MRVKDLIKEWFSKWEEGDFLNLPVSDNFSHISPYGTITGKDKYIELVETNKDKFLGHRFELHDELYGEERACVRYTAIQDDFSLEVSEWYYVRDGLIEEIVAYYNIEGEISEDRKLSNPEAFE